MLEGNSHCSSRVSERSPISAPTTDNDGARYPYSSIARRRRWHASSHGKGTATALPCAVALAPAAAGGAAQTRARRPHARCHVARPRCPARRDDRSHPTPAGPRAPRVKHETTLCMHACMHACVPAPTAYGTPPDPPRPRAALATAGRQPARWHDG